MIRRVIVIALLFAPVAHAGVAELFSRLRGLPDVVGVTAMELSVKTNALKIVKPGGSHRTRIGNHPSARRDEVHGALEKWLGISIVR